MGGERSYLENRADGSDIGVKDCYRYSLLNNTWMEMSTMLAERYNFAATLINDHHHRS